MIRSCIALKRQWEFDDIVFYKTVLYPVPTAQHRKMQTENLLYVTYEFSSPEGEPYCHVTEYPFLSLKST